MEDTKKGEAHRKCKNKEEDCLSFCFVGGECAKGGVSYIPVPSTLHSNYRSILAHSIFAPPWFYPFSPLSPSTSFPPLSPSSYNNLASAAVVVAAAFVVNVTHSDPVSLFV